MTLSNVPLLVFDTNILMDVLLGRDDSAALLVELAVQGTIELVIPEYVLFEFQGTAARWVTSQRKRLDDLKQGTKEWRRCSDLDESSEQIRRSAAALMTTLDDIGSKVETVLASIREAATVVSHTAELHFLGELRCLRGLPPDRPLDGLKDCRIYEAILAIARDDSGIERHKYLVTKDADFDVDALRHELADLGFTIRKDIGRLYGELLRPFAWSSGIYKDTRASVSSQRGGDGQGCGSKSKAAPESFLR